MANSRTNKQDVIGNANAGSFVALAHPDPHNDSGIWPYTAANATETNDMIAWEFFDQLTTHITQVSRSTSFEHPFSRSFLLSIVVILTYRHQRRPHHADT
jgi:hypothetical protein